MTRIHGIFLVGAAALSLTACDGGGRKYPPGYTDDGVKFDENGWRYFPSEKSLVISYFPTNGRAKVSFSCDLPEDTSEVAQMLNLDRLEITTGEFVPLQQWPQPDLVVAVGKGEAAGQAVLDPWEKGNPNMTIKVDGRSRKQMLQGIKRGLPIKLSFADQTRDIPGPPQSMREAFARKCQGES